MKPFLPSHVVKIFLLLHCLLASSQRKKLRYSDLDFEVSAVFMCVCACVLARGLEGHLSLEGPLLKLAQVPLQTEPDSTRLWFLWDPPNIPSLPKPEASSSMKRARSCPRGPSSGQRYGDPGCRVPSVGGWFTELLQ